MKNEADARLLLGIAQLHAGNKDDAHKTFEQVKGDPKLERLAPCGKSARARRSAGAVESHFRRAIHGNQGGRADAFGHVQDHGRRRRRRM